MLVVYRFTVRLSIYYSQNVTVCHTEAMDKEVNILLVDIELHYLISLGHMRKFPVKMLS